MNNFNVTEYKEILLYYYCLATSMDEEIDRLWNSFDANQSEMEIIFRKVLPYSVKVAAQGALIYARGFEKERKLIVTPNTTLPWLYLTVLPLKTETFILLVKHKIDHDYDNWIKNFNNMNDLEKLDVINNMIFTELDDFFVSQDVNCEDLKQLRFTKDDTFESLKRRTVIIKNHLLPYPNSPSQTR